MTQELFGIGDLKQAQRLSSTTHASVETGDIKSFKEILAEKQAALESTPELRSIAPEMEEAERAFALMMEIRGKLEAAYRELSLPEN